MQTDKNIFEQENTREGREMKRLENRVVRLSDLQQLSETCDDVVGYVYREKSLDSSRTGSGRIRKVLDDHDFGIRFGPGDFFVTYKFHKNDNSIESTSIRYSNGMEYAVLHRQYCNENRIPFYDHAGAFQQQNGGGIMDLLDRNRIEALAGLAGLAKQVFAPPPNNADATNLKLMELLAARSNNGLSDQIVIESIKSMRPQAAAALPPPSPRESLRDQMDLFRELAEVRELVQPKDKEEKETGPMSFLIEKALEILPDILAKHNGNETAAAQALKQQNIFVRTMLKKPSVQKEFYAAAVENYGPESAARWARGFGLEPSAITSPAAPKQALKMSGNTAGVNTY